MAGKLNLDFKTVGALTALTLIILQAGGLMFEWLNIYLGPVFILIPVMVSCLLALSIWKKSITGYPVQKSDVFVWLFVTAIAILSLLFMRDLVPEVFKPSVMAFQSLVGIGG